MAKKQGKDNLFWEAYNNMAQKSEQRKFRAFVKTCGRDWHNFNQTDCRTPIAKLPAHLALSLCNYLGWNLQETINKELNPPQPNMSGIPHQAIDQNLYLLNITQLRIRAKQEGATSLVEEEEGTIYKVGGQDCLNERDALIQAIERKRRAKGGGK